MFRIRVHRDDIITLYFIQSRLGVGTVHQNETSAVFQVTDKVELQEVIIPLFTEFPLLTTKVLDFNDFKDLLLNTKPEKEALSIVEQINTKRTDFSDYAAYIQTIQVSDLTAEYILGFTEGEGTFGFKNISCYFQLAQHKKSIAVLILIAKYLNIENVSMTVNSKTDVLSLVVSSVDTLNSNLLDFYIALNFGSRKYEDFEY